MTDTQQPHQDAGENKDKPLIRILSFDGGGIRGVAVARILQEIEERLANCQNNVPKTLREQATIMVGTSTGGLISLLLSMKRGEREPMRAKEVRALYENQAATIFTKSYTWIATSFIVLLFIVAIILVLVFLIGGITYDYLKNQETDDEEAAAWFYFLVIGLPLFTLIFGYYAIKIYHTFLFNKFSQKGLKKIVKGLFGDDKLDKAAGLVGVCATDLGTNKSVLLNSYRAKMCPKDLLHNAELHLIAKATAAAPTYFKYVKFNTRRSDYSQNEEKVEPSIWNEKVEDPQKPYHYESEFYKMEDGGTSNNNPASLGLKLAKIYCEEQDYNPNDCRFQIISFGTGDASRSKSTKESQVTSQVASQGNTGALEITSARTRTWNRFKRYTKNIVNAWKPSLKGDDDPSGDSDEDELEKKHFKPKSKIPFKKIFEIVGSILRLILWPVYTLYVFTLGLFLKWSFKSDAGLIQILRRIQTNPFEMESKSNHVDRKLRRIEKKSKGRIQYHRVQFNVRQSQKAHLDDHSKENIAKLIWRAERYIASQEFKKVMEYFTTEEPKLQKDLNYSPRPQIPQPASH